MSKVKLDGKLEGDEIIETKWFTVSRIGVIFLIGLVAVAGIFTILIFNVGYDSKQGWYWKPSSLDVDIKVEKEK